ncbi:SIMPL domain-containing protein [Argonema galeatum]|uniref:SIMPL domain-containing protein n=1 Tax=Argonema galeatum TaxID=2942762 RepID=UPI002011559E|nr:SIMPL domain-containing protein [Argonema galeatum]MCL1467786.1 SIMPL domain-containing protein [Argonema galeatum A003/A1]
MSKFLPVVYHTLFTAATIVGLWMGATKNSSAENLVTVKSSNFDTHQLSSSALEAGFSVSQATDSLTPSLINGRAIAVIGQGQATAPADTARLEFRFASRAPAEPPPPAATETPAEETASLPGEELLKPVVDALVAIKVPKDNITIETSSLENPKLLVKLDKPTRERVQEVVKVASSALQGGDALFIQGIGAEYAVNNCQPLESTARRAALKDAQNQVRGIASEMGVEVGELLLVTVYPIVSPASVSACGSKVAVPTSPFAALSENTPPYNPSAPTEVQVRSQVSVTYAIK